MSGKKTHGSFPIDPHTKNVLTSGTTTILHNTVEIANQNMGNKVIQTNNRSLTRDCMV
ncbi:MAG: hypothetical protein ACOZAN_01525 [Patescibacteria group bacterium]